MRRYTVLVMLLMLSQLKAWSSVTDSIPADPKDVSTADALLTAVYTTISGPAGETRNWDRFRTLFLPEARLVATGKRADGMMGKRTMSVEDYIKTSGPFLEKDGFYEKEIGRKTDQFGSVMQVFSTYESRKTLQDEKPFMRGINSIQLWFDGKRWWVLTIFWQAESPELPVPAQYIN
ncbi:MAG: hypothetical protein J0M10_14295 [Chitinophagales bacterium]|nr:hypothetical protein [Chitinophagales bacterium]